MNYLYIMSPRADMLTSLDDTFAFGLVQHGTLLARQSCAMQLVKPIALLPCTKLQDEATSARYSKSADTL